MSKEQSSSEITAEDLFKSSEGGVIARQAQGERDENACYHNCVDSGGNRQKCFIFCYNVGKVLSRS